MSVEDSVRLLQLMGTAVGRGAMAVGVEYQGGAVEGLGNPMVTLLLYWVGVRGYVELVLRRT